MLYDWGYASYFNPYLVVPQTVIVQQPGVIAAQPAVVYDYAQPIDPSTPPPAASTTDQAMAIFDQARTSFKAGDYTSALDLCDQALAQLPNDPTLHEFRGLALFALRRYDEAATPLYAVLSIGPGWDWPTLIGLYPDAEPYTRQIRDLESRVRGEPDSAPVRFVLAYHYMAQGHGDAALAQFQEIVRLQPKDAVSADLVRQLRKAAQPQPAAPDPPAASGGPLAPTTAGAAPPLTPPREEGRLEGAWTAAPAEGTTIRLSFLEDGTFSWQVEQQGKTQEFRGERTYGNGILTLAQSGQEGQPPMVGRVSWEDRDHFRFRLIGGPPDDPGLKFRKTP
jgi:tetratricopeptide (TPR) repeat protein